MALTVVVRSGEKPGEPELALTLDAPRIVVGRGDACEVRLPDPSVSPRHASIRQKGHGYVVVDEGSLTGTWVGKAKLSPQASYPVQSGDLVRFGRVWIELRVEARLVTGSGAAAAKEIALGLVARALALDGEEPGPRITVVDGPDRGAALLLREAGRAYSIGRSRECDLVLTDADAGRRHALVLRKGDALAVQDLGSSRAATLDGVALSSAETTWRPGQEVVIAKTVLALDYAAAQALVDIERGPDERLRDGESVEPPRPASEPTPAPAAASTSSTEPTPDVPLAELDLSAPIPRGTPAKAAQPGSWGALDGIVILIAVGVLAVSAFAAWWLLGR